MGKNKRAAKAAWRAAAAATTTLPAATPSPPHSLDTHAPTSNVGELPVRTPQHQRESQPASALAAHLAQSPAPSLIIEPATPIADATPASAVEDTTHTQDRHAPNTCAATRKREPPPALTTTTNTPHEPPHASPSPPMQPSPFPALSTPVTAAITALAARVHAAGPPAFFVTTPTHTFDDVRAELPAAPGSIADPAHATCVHDPPPRLATTREEVHPDLLAAIIEDGRRLQRQAARMQMPEQPSATTWDDGWLEGYQQGCEEGYEQGREEGYKQGREEGYSEGVEAARAEVSTPHRVNTGVQADHPFPSPQPRPSARVDAAVQSDSPPCSPVPYANPCASPHAPADSRAPPIADHSMRNVAIAVVQMDDAITPTRVDSASQTLDLTDFATPTHNNNTIKAHLHPSVHVVTPSTNTPPSHTTFNSFSWADDAATLPVNNVTPLALSLTRDFSVLRTPSSRLPFESLQRRARRSRMHPACRTRSQPPPPPPPLPIITRCHPSGLRTGRPSVTIQSSPALMPMVPHIAPLNWDADPHLCELSRILQGLGWVHSGFG